MKITKMDRLATEMICINLIAHLKADFDLTTDECVDLIMKYNSKDRAEDFSHYLFRTVLSKKGFVLE